MLIFLLFVYSNGTLLPFENIYNPNEIHKQEANYEANDIERCHTETHAQTISFSSDSGAFSAR